MNTFIQILLGFMVGYLVISQIGSSIAMVVMESRKAASTGSPKWHIYLGATFTPGPFLLVGTIAVLTVRQRSLPRPMHAP